MESLEVDPVFNQNIEMKNKVFPGLIGSKVKNRN